MWMQALIALYLINTRGKMTLALPAYRYVPGRNPHPKESPDGHSYRQSYHCSDQEAYLFGIMLFNHGYFWECHEAFESIWLPNRTDPISGPFLQGIIIVAAAMLKLWMGQKTSFDKLISAAMDKFALLEINPLFGLDLATWKNQIANFSKTANKYLNMDPLLAKDFPYVILDIA